MTIEIGKVYYYPEKTKIQICAKVDSDNFETNVAECEEKCQDCCAQMIDVYETRAVKCIGIKSEEGKVYAKVWDVSVEDYFEWVDDWTDEWIVSDTLKETVTECDGECFALNKELMR